MVAVAIEKRFEVNGLNIAAQYWRNGDTGKSVMQKRLPLICLHGWLDNSSSFSALAPQLDAQEILALDFAGHGHSEHRSKHGSYNIWEDLEDIIGVADQLGWRRFNLLGHSRGGFVAFLLATAMPELIGKQVLLDSLLPPPETTPFIEQLRKHLLDRRKLADKKPTVYGSIDAAIAQRLKSTMLSPDEARAMFERDLKAVEGGYAWRHDPRLHAASAVKLIEPHIDSVLNSLDTDTEIILAEKSIIAQYMDEHEVKAMIKGYDRIRLDYHPGNHHLHMEQPQILSLAKKINRAFAG